MQQNQSALTYERDHPVKLFFYNKSDPRIFLYKFPRYKWMGATLNFAHAKAWLVLLWTLLPAGILLLPVPLLTSLRLSTEYAVGYVGLCILYITGIIVYYFHMATVEEKLQESNPEKIKMNAHWSGWVLGLLCLAAYCVLLACCRWYIVTGEDLASGRPWIRFAIVQIQDTTENSLDPDNGLTLYVFRFAPEPVYRHYRLNDERYSPIWMSGDEITFTGKQVSAWDTFGWTEYKLIRERLRSQALPAEQARELHRRMIDVYHSPLSKSQRSSEINRLREEPEGDHSRIP